MRLLFEFDRASLIILFFVNTCSTASKFRNRKISNDVGIDIKPNGDFDLCRLLSSTSCTYLHAFTNVTGSTKSLNSVNDSQGHMRIFSARVQEIMTPASPAVVTTFWSPVAICRSSFGMYIGASFPLIFVPIRVPSYHVKRNQCWCFLSGVNPSQICFLTSGSLANRGDTFSLQGYRRGWKNLGCWYSRLRSRRWK